jgi:HAD superfamily hydrolase (TIGR01509 family)
MMEKEPMDTAASLTAAAKTGDGPIALQGGIAAIIFDCDGVLVDSEIVACRAVAELIAKYEPQAPVEELVEQLVGIPDSHIVRQVAERFGTVFPADIGPRMAQVIDEALALGLDAIPGVRAALESLGDLPMAVASNSHFARVRRSLAIAGLTPLFGDHVYTPEVVERPKPAPDLYLHAAARLGVAPAHCLVIEDSVPGTTAGVAAGMTVIGFLGGRHIRDGHADRLRAAGARLICPHMDDLPALVAGLAASPHQG